MYVILAILVAIPYLGFVGLKMWYDNKIEKIANAKFIIVDKESMSLKLFDYTGSVLNSYGISCGKNLGDKQKGRFENARRNFPYNRNRRIFNLGA